MGRATNTPEQFLPLKPLVFHALLALEPEELHGYGIKKAVAVRTDGAIDLKPGTLYRLLARLLKQGLISETDGPADDASTDERRRYYRMTDLGREVLKAEAVRLARLLGDEQVQGLLG